MGSRVEELLCQLVAAPSPSKEEGPAVDVLENFLHGAHPFPIRRLLRADRNLGAVRQGEEPGPTLWLASHLDTVPSTASWTRDPLRPTREGGKLYGLGANDAKGCLAAMTLAFLSTPIRRGKLVLAATCEEETGRNGLEVFGRSLPPADHAIIGEPTGLNIAVAQNGMLILDCVAVGRAGHAARPHLADNAISKAARDIVRLDQLLLDRVHPTAGATSKSVTLVNAGSRHNVIPDRCSFTVDLRTTAAYTHAELVKIIQDLLESEVSVRSDRFHPVATPEGSLLLSAAKKSCPEARTFSSPTLSDWAHVGGVDAIKWGPGLSEVSHTADEWVEVGMVEAAVEAYAGVISELLG